MTPSEQIRDICRRLKASWRLTRQTEEFHLEQDEIRHDLEDLARRFEGQNAEISRETICERRIG